MMSRVIFGERERCSHNLRLLVTGKSNICMICECNKIDDLLRMECSGNRRLLSGSISEIIHRFRVMDSILDFPIDENHVEILLSPLLRTSLGVLKIHHDEVGNVVAQALDKMCSKVPQKKLESFLQDLSAQMLERISYGNLKCLSVLLERKECISSFLKTSGAAVLPKLFDALEFHAFNIKCPLPRPTAAAMMMLAVAPPSTTSLLEINKVINEKQNPSSHSFAASTTSDSSNGTPAEKESLKIVENIFVILEATCPTDAFLLVTDNERGESQLLSLTSSKEAFTIFRPHLKKIIMACRKLLSFNEIVRMVQFSTKILRFLEKVFHHPETLEHDIIFASSLFSVIKKLFYCHSTEIKIAALHLVKRMIVTYKHTVEVVNEDPLTDKGNVAYFPEIISQVDLVHIITETMNTSYENLFRDALQVLDLINEISLFRNGQMIPVLEVTLRIAKMYIPEKFCSKDTFEALNRLVRNILTSLEAASIPPGIQLQLMYLFESLPNNWTSRQFLRWIKLLLFCREAELHDKLWSIFLAFVQRSKNLEKHCVISMKCVVLIAYALMKCNLPQISCENIESDSMPEMDRMNEKGRQELAKKLMHYLMERTFLPSIWAMVRYGTTNDYLYIATLLELLGNYSVEYLSTGSTFFEQPNFETVQLIYDSENGNPDPSQSQSQDPLYDVKIEPTSVLQLEGVSYWTPKLYMQILGAIRLNFEFIQIQQIFDLWNENIARILSVCCTANLPQLQNSLNCQSDLSSLEGCDQVIIKRILDSLDIEAKNWSLYIGKDIFSSSGAYCIGKQKHDVVLAFYFCYALFAGKDLMEFLDAGFTKRYLSFLHDCVGRYDMTREIDEESDLDWGNLTFYLRTALLISTALPPESNKRFSSVFEILFNESPEAYPRFENEIMVYQCAAFISLFRWRLYINFVSLIEMWLERDRKDCLEFFVNANSDDGLNEEISSSLIAVAAKGKPETSKLMIEIAEKRLQRFELTFDPNVVKANIHELMGKIAFDADRENLLSFSNVIQLVIKDDYMFTSSQQFPLEFLYEIVHFMLKFPPISRSCLKLLVKMLENQVTLNKVSIFLIGHKDLIQYLGNRLTTNDKADVEESMHAHKLLALLINQNEAKFPSQGSQVPTITWKLSSVLLYIHDAPKIEILDFLLAVFRVNFKCPIIQVEEINGPADQFAEVLLTLLFHLQAVLHKSAFNEPKERLWEILFEYLRLAETDVIKCPEFPTEVLFQPWIKVTIFHLCQTNHPLTQAPVIALEFLLKWTHMMLMNKSQNPQKRTPLQNSFVFQPYMDLFKKIRECRKSPSSPSTPSKQKLLSQEIRNNLGEKNWNLFSIGKKIELVSAISKNCKTFIKSM